MKAPAFQFYAADFLMGTAHMTASEVGAYIRLLAHQWDRGFLPNDNKALATLAQVFSMRPRVLEKFKLCDDGVLRNMRLETERSKQIAYRSAKSSAGSIGGKVSGESRKVKANMKQNGSSASDLLQANGEQNEALQSSSSSSEEGLAVRARDASDIPTLEQWLTNATFIGYDPTEAETAWNSLEAMGWQRDGQPVRCWRKLQNVYRNRHQERREQNRQKAALRSDYSKPKRRGPNI